MAVIFDDGTSSADLAFVSLTLPVGYSATFTNTSPEADALTACFGAFTELRFWNGITREWIHIKVHVNHKGALSVIESEFLGMSGVVHTTLTGGSIRLRRTPSHDMVILELL